MVGMFHGYVSHNQMGTMVLWCSQSNGHCHGIWSTGHWAGDEAVDYLGIVDDPRWSFMVASGNGKP